MLNKLYKLKPILLTFLTLVIGVFGGYLIHDAQFKSATQISPSDITASIREKNNNVLIAPLLVCAETHNNFVTTDLTQMISEYIQKNINSGAATQISFYYKDLSSGKWTGVSEDAPYAPASLLKVPLMIAYYKKSEKEKDLLSKELFYKGGKDMNAMETIKPARAILPGKKYTVQELLSYTIEYSDNNAALLLTDNISDDEITQIFKDLELPLPTAINGSTDYLSARAYSVFFRALYNATYLTQEDSIAALTLLTKPDFPDGISSGVDKNILTANKFGERSIIEADKKVSTRELHDCGIVYAQRPYLLCIMTKGTNFTDLKKTIKVISEMTYSFQKKRITSIH